MLLLTIQAFARTRLEEYALILADAPVARQISSRGGLHTQEAASRVARIQTAQQNLRQELALRKVHVSGSAQTLLNAVFVRVPRERVTELRSLPGVQRVLWMPPMKRHLNVAVNLVNVPIAWTVLPGGAAHAGAGEKIAIIDSGIDNTHPAFQDSSLAIPAGFPKGRPQDLPYTNHKIIVARNYEPMFALPDDPTPRDRSGHGTALAMIAAGNTTKGPLATITGVAPKAWLGNYKIFGTPGVNDTTYGSIVIQALEDAYNDQMDIAVLAFGYPAVYGPLDQDSTVCNNGTGVPSQYQNACDVSAQAVENAVQGGMTVVVSAGNDAQTSTVPPALNSVNSPGTAPSAITVGAFTNQHVFYSAVQVKGSSAPSSLQSIDALVGDGPKLQRPLTGPLQDVSAADSTGLACSALPGSSFANAIVLIERGNCDYSTKINNAQQAGAIGVVIYQSDPNALPYSSLGAENTGIPAVMIGNADGVNLKTYLASNANAQVTLDPTLHEEGATADALSDFTSRGPSIDYNIKPELVAVGQGIYTATESLDPSGDLYDPTGYTTVDGSSFAAAMVAGAAALVLQNNPSFKDLPGQIKSALVNTASANTVFDNSNSGEPLIAAAGVGSLNVAAAIVPGATAEPATVSFGLVGPQSTPKPVLLTITNISNSTKTFSLFATPNPSEYDPDSSDLITIQPGTVQLAAGQQATVTVSLQGNFSSPQKIYDGIITIQGLSTNLSVPYWYLVDDITANAPFDLMPVINSNFFGVVDDKCWQISFKVLDPYGVPVGFLPVQFSSPDGGALSTDSKCPSDPTTDKYGIASANVDLGSSAGSETFQATAQGLNNAMATFYATVREMPTITANKVSDAASFQVGSGLAPGSYIAIFGSALTDATQTLSTNFLPFSMSGASVSFWSSDYTVAWPGRLWYVSPTQINVQVPWELSGWTSAQMFVNVDGIATTAYTVPIADYLPAMYKYNNLAIAQDTNYQLITSANPARRGKTIIIYANGMGPVVNAPASGEAAPLTLPYSTTQITPTVTIGNVGADVGFSGLTPGSIGLYQLNVEVPQNAPTGVQPVVVKQNGVTSQAANLPIQ